MTTGLRYADDTPVPDADLEMIARAFLFRSARRWIEFHAAAEYRRTCCCCGRGA
ncbi:hypothetical protein [Nocardia terpenica]|uniref:hypothetical protein n=1 Tax=Nocardia terpenica TaxID=455432 RepID=UPI0012FD8914|nr:hypothetical protein [Nocardia terpenica]